MTIILNGEKRPLPEACPLNELLDGWGYEKGFAVAVNGIFVPRPIYRDTIIKQGDSVEVLVPMQGG